MNRHKSNSILTEDTNSSIVIHDNGISVITFFSKKDMRPDENFEEHWIIDEYEQVDTWFSNEIIEKKL